MWSGGADSTVIVDQMLRKTTDELVLCHLIFKNDFDKDIEDLRHQKHSAIAAAQIVALPHIIDYWAQEGLRPVTFDVMRYNFPLVHSSGSHRAMLPFLGALAVKNHSADRFITGVSPVTLRIELSKKRHENNEAIFDLLMQRPVTEPKVRNDLSLPGTKLIGVPIENKYAGMRWEKPLVSWGWGKKGVVKELPSELRKLVVTCDNPTTYEERWERCGECFRCNKWEALGGLK